MDLIRVVMIVQQMAIYLVDLMVEKWADQKAYCIDGHLFYLITLQRIDLMVLQMIDLRDGQKALWMNHIIYI